MANAKKCDVCGRYYDPPRALGGITCITINCNNSNFNKYYDVCDNCAAHVKEFLNSYKTDGSDKNE